MRIEDGALSLPIMQTRIGGPTRNGLRTGTHRLKDPPPPPTQDEIDATAAKTYGKLAALKGMTPAQVQALVDANVSTLADVKDALKTLAIAASILARRI